MKYKALINYLFPPNGTAKSVLPIIRQRALVRHHVTSEQAIKNMAKAFGGQENGGAE